MTLWKLVIKQYHIAIIGLVLASLLSAFAGIAVIAHINSALIIINGDPLTLLQQFIALLILLLLLRFIAQYSLTFIGHKFVYEFRNNLIKRYMDTDIATIEKIGSARVLASLSKDIDKIQSAFINAPSFIQSSILSFVAFIYLGYLNLNLLLIVLLSVLTIAAIGSMLVKQVYQHFSIVRETEDYLYKDFESIIHGRKELSLNRHRAKLLYQNEYLKHADTIRKHIIKGDTYHLTALNWADVMILGNIGMVFFLANVLHWADTSTATTFAITILFLKSPLTQTFGMIPSFLNASVSFKKITELQLESSHSFGNYHDKFDITNIETTNIDWNKIEFKQICYEYLDNEGVPSFHIGPIDFTIHRGEAIFLIGGNGSGKSTFAKIITGLYKPISGNIMIDSLSISDEERNRYRQQFSAIYTDLHLFKTLVGKQDKLTTEEKELMQEWLYLLDMHHKLKIDETDKVLNEDLSQGQKKRLAMLLAVLEQKDIILLDEWAADQDPQFRRTFYFDIIPKLKKIGKTLIIISHDDHYFEQADRLLQMQNGQLIELFGQERTNACRDVISSINESY